ncbi:MAG: glycosyltransferase family 4 protein [Desulfobacterales bacterium]|nr:glycosyltransferase family 4 protein [Desulfobacterales bacterium]
MKILYHHRTLGDGAEGIHIMEMISAFEKLGHRVILAGHSITPYDTPEVISILSKIKNLIKGPVYELLEIAYNLYGFINIQKIINKLSPDLIYDRYMIFNYSSIFAGRRNKIPVFIEVNAPLALERNFESDESLKFKKIAYKMETLIPKNADKVFVVSTPLKKYLISIGVPLKKIIVLPNGVNTQKFYKKAKPEYLMKRLGLNKNNIIIGFVGILRPWHGIDTLIESFRIVCSQFPQAILLIVGDGPIRKEIEDIADKIQIKKNLIITGRIPHNNVSDYISLFDIAVTPKATFYASPMKIVEYMAQGKPVIAPDMENIRDIVSHGKEGLLFKDGLLSDSMIQLLANESLRALLGNGGIEKTRCSLNWLANAKRITNEFKLYQK